MASAWQHVCVHVCYRGTAAWPPALSAPNNHASVVAKDELDTMLAYAQLGRRVPLLLLANKMDLPSALSPPELALVSLRACQVHMNDI